MEKIMISLWKAPEPTAEQWRESLITLRDELTNLGARQIRVMVADEAVAAADSQRLINSPEPLEGMITLWLDSASLLAPIHDLIATQVVRQEAYLVAESEPYPELRRERIARFDADVALGERTPGMCQVALLKKPAELTYDQWYSNWRDGHGPNAYPLQSNFGYRQNTVVRVLTPGAAEIHAIVEEHFPDQAIGSPDGFYDAGGDPALLAERKQAMWVSTRQFLDPTETDCIQTSFYQLTGW